MAISDSINGLISKGTNVLGVTNALSDFLPPSLRTALGTFINGPSKNTPPSNRNLNTFRSNFNRYGGFARNSLFYVTIPTPQMMTGALSAGQTASALDLSLLCESVSLPGVSLATSEIRRYGYGAVEKKPYAPIFTDQTFSFLGDNKGIVHGHFYSWLNGIVKSDLNANDRLNQGYNGLSAYEVEYKENYAVDITITCLDETDQNIIICKLNQAYPIFLGDVSLSWSDNDSIMKVPVTFTFLNWNLETININSALQSPASELSGLQKLIKVGTAIQTLASLRKPTGIADIVNTVGNAKIAIGGLGGLF